MHEHELPVCRELLIKLAMRCNIVCGYCYWFRDTEVYEKPAILLEEVQDALVAKIANHTALYSLPNFSILFHGGEPLLFGKQRFVCFCEKLRQSESISKTRYRISVTTNTLLIDADWIKIFRDFNIRVTISVDGPPAINDKRRKDFGGHGTYSRIRSAIELLQNEDLEFGTLAVCDPQTDPVQLLTHFVDELKILKFDVLLPDNTHSDDIDRVDEYYMRLFDLWFNEYASRGVEIRYLNSIIRGLLGGYSTTQSIGGGPINTATVLTDGSLEALDTVRIIGSGSTKTRLNVLKNEIQDIHNDSLWLELNQAALALPRPCSNCEVRNVCGGGHIASRWSVENRFDNPTVYCKDLKNIIPYIWDRIKGSLYLRFADGTRTECLYD